MAGLFAYFYVWTFHHKASRIAKRIGRARAYVVCVGVMWIVLVSNLTGYVIGTGQRWFNGRRYRGRMETYLASS